MSELFFTTTFMSKLKEAQRERTNLDQNCRAGKQQNQDANLGSMGSKAIPTSRHKQKRRGKIELPLTSCALGYKSYSFFQPGEAGYSFSDHQTLHSQATGPLSL